MGAKELERYLMRDAVGLWNLTANNLFIGLSMEGSVPPAITILNSSWKGQIG